MDMKKPFNIGKIQINPPTIMAPLAGITNLPFRIIAKESGCGLVCSEMISANGLVYNSEKTKRMLESNPVERPLSVQLFGSGPDIMAEAARIVEARGADILDINCGCAVKKVTKTFSGVALMKDPENAEAVIKAVRAAIRIPLTIKIRSGWEASGSQAFRLARIAEENGVDAIAIHPRTASQGFRGNADWSLIRKIKNEVSIPVIGNGDVTSVDDAIKMFTDTGCDGIMIGRAAIGDPALFRRIQRRLENLPPIPPDIDEHFDIMERYLESNLEYMAERIACKIMRGRLSWFVKGLPGCNSFKKNLIKISTGNDARSLIRDYRDWLKNDEGMEKLSRCERFNK